MIGSRSILRGILAILSAIGVRLLARQPFRRGWQCEMNQCNEAYGMSDGWTSQALTQANAAEAFWLRGLMPTAWVAAPPPP
eukprot:9391584-Pyramimonas_sp.AAC.1